MRTRTAAIAALLLAGCAARQPTFRNPVPSAEYVQQVVLLDGEEKTARALSVEKLAAFVSAVESAAVKAARAHPLSRQFIIMAVLDGSPKAEFWSMVHARPNGDAAAAAKTLYAELGQVRAPDVAERLSIRIHIDVDD